MIRRGKMAKKRNSPPKAGKTRPVVKKMSLKAKAAGAEARKANRLKAQKNAMKEQERQRVINAENARMRVEELLGNGVFAEYISKNVGKKAINIIKTLNSPQTDEKLAADLNLKINEVRRILNVLDSYGVARYNANKDNKGWLTFEWYLDTEKLSELHQNAMTSQAEGAYKLPDNCNDFFFCGKCYDEQKVIRPFDAAFETDFKCDNCGKQLKQLNKDQARTMFEQSSVEPSEAAGA